MTTNEELRGHGSHSRYRLIAEFNLETEDGDSFPSDVAGATCEALRERMEALVTGVSEFGAIAVYSSVSVEHGGRGHISLLAQLSTLQSELATCRSTAVEPWTAEQPIANEARRFKGREWVPLELAESQLQFWQKRDYQHSVTNDRLTAELAACREALGKIASKEPRHELDDGEPGRRCHHCGYRWKDSGPERHGPTCAFVAARAALDRARSDEREACAKVASARQRLAHDGLDLTGFRGENAVARAIASAIRSRGSVGGEK